MNFSYIKRIFTASVTVSALMVMTVATGCSKWTEPQSIDFDKGITVPSADYLSALRAFKDSAHKVSFVSMQAPSSAPMSRNQHIMAMPDSVDYICVRNSVKGIHSSIVSEISQVNELYGTTVLCDVNYTSIYDEWTALEEAKEDQPAGTEDEFKAFVKERVNAQIACCDKYGFGGIVVTFEATTLGLHKVGQKVFFSAIDGWRGSHSNHLLVFRGAVDQLIDKSIIDYCKYVVVQIGKAYSKGMISSEVKSIFRGVDAGKDKIIVEVAVPNEENPQNAEYIEAYQPIVAAQWVNEPAKGFGKMGIFVNNIQEDYFAGKSYSVVRDAITVLNETAVVE